MKKHITKIITLAALCAVMLTVFLIPASAASTYTDAIKNATATPYNDYDYKYTLSQSGNTFSGVSSGDGFVRTIEPVPLPDYAIYHLSFTCNTYFTLSIRGNGKQMEVLRSAGNNIAFPDGRTLKDWLNHDYTLGDFVDLYYYHDMKNDTLTIWTSRDGTEMAPYGGYVDNVCTVKLSSYETDYDTSKAPFPVYFYFVSIDTATRFSLITCEVFTFAHALGEEDIYYFTEKQGMTGMTTNFNTTAYEKYHEGFEAGQQEAYQDGFLDGYDSGLYTGHATGKTEGYEQGKKEGYDLGYAEGKDYGYFAGEQSTVKDDFGKLALSVVSAPFTAISNMLNFEIFGINLAGLVFFMFTAILIVFVLRRLL